DAPLVTEEPDAGLPVSVDAGAPIVDTARPHSPPAPAAPAPSGDKAPTLTGTWSLEIDQDGRGFSPHVEGSRAILYQRGTRVVGEELVGSRLIASFDGVLEPARLRGTYTEAGVKTWIDSPYLIIVENQGRRVIMTLSHALKSGPLRLRLRSIDPLAAPSP
ncbi:MAG: hypothetical protein KC466_16325, partial [Myxococcales bacterium]|nr:hypothetical protein [Myxococcales bacterium]